VRGQASSIARQKADLVLLAGRYQPGDGRLEFAQGHRRVGKVWTDLLLIPRRDLVEALRAGRRVYAAKPKSLAHDFELLHSISLAERPGEPRLQSDGLPGKAGDDLGLPLV
jgi:hypothetical protein